MSGPSRVLAIEAGPSGATNKGKVPLEITEALNFELNNVLDLTLISTLYELF